MRYTLESALPLNAFSPRLRGPFGHGMTLEGGGGSWNPVNIINDAVSSVGDALASIDPGPAIGSALASIDPGPAIGKGLAELDKGVNNALPGGWLTVGALAAMVAAPYLSAYLAAEGAVGAGAAEFAAADAAGLAAQGLSEAQIAETLAAAGMDSFAAADAASLAASGLSQADIAANLGVYGDSLFAADAATAAQAAVASGQLSPAVDIEAFTSQGASLQDIPTLAQNGFTPETLNTFNAQGFTPGDVLELTNQGFDPSTVQQFGSMNYTPSDIANLQQMGFGNQEITSFANAGLEPNTISYYAEAGYDPQAVAQAMIQDPTNELGQGLNQLIANGPEASWSTAVAEPVVPPTTGVEGSIAPTVNAGTGLNPALPGPNSGVFGALNPAIPETAVVGTGLDGTTIGQTYLAGANGGAAMTGGILGTGIGATPIEASSIGLNANMAGGIGATQAAAGLEGMSGGALGNPLVDAQLAGQSVGSQVKDAYDTYKKASAVNNLVNAATGGGATAATGQGIGSTLGQLAGAGAIGAGLAGMAGTDVGTGQAQMNYTPGAMNYTQLQQGGVNPGYMVNAVEPYYGQQYDWGAKSMSPEQLNELINGIR